MGPASKGLGRKQDILFYEKVQTSHPRQMSTHLPDENGLTEKPFVHPSILFSGDVFPYLHAGISSFSHSMAVGTIDPSPI